MSRAAPFALCPEAFSPCQDWGDAHASAVSATILVTFASSYCYDGDGLLQSDICILDKCSDRVGEVRRNNETSRFQTRLRHFPLRRISRPPRAFNGPRFCWQERMRKMYSTEKKRRNGLWQRAQQSVDIARGTMTMGRPSLRLRRGPSLYRASLAGSLPFLSLSRQQDHEGAS